MVELNSEAAQKIQELGYDGEGMPSPSCEQVIDWLRKRHNVLAWVSPVPHAVGGHVWWMGRVMHSFDEAGGCWMQPVMERSSYERALKSTTATALTILGVIKS